MAKKKFNCVICGKEFIANKNSNIKSCYLHRGAVKYRSQSICRQRVFDLRDLLNTRLKSIQIVSTGGYSNYILRNRKLNIGCSIKNLKELKDCNKFITDIISDLNKDLKEIEKIREENDNTCKKN